MMYTEYISGMLNNIFIILVLDVSTTTVARRYDKYYGLTVSVLILYDFNLILLVFIF